MGLSFSHLLLFLVIVLVVFGAGKLPQVMGDLAKGFRAFKDGMKDAESSNSLAELPPSNKDKRT